MAKDFATMEDSNRSSNRSIHEVSDPARRIVLGAGTAASLAPWAALLSGCAGPAAPGGGPKLGFKGVAAGSADAVVVPEGYTATPLLPWGDPVGLAAGLPTFRFDASNSAAEQALQMGMHHDGLHYYPLDGSRRGLLVVNHEYADHGLLYPDGMLSWTAEKVAKSQAAHGVSVTEIEFVQGRWKARRPSPYARRITATTPFALGGPAAAHALMKTAADPEGRLVLGTFANCAAGMTPWGTYLAGEENFQDYFSTADQPTAHERRYGLRRRSWYRWHEHDPRFDTVRHPNEPNRFGWIVEIDPYDPASVPVKRTALGRGAHEGAWVTLTRAGRAVVYSGEDAAFEYIYKFVSRDPMRAAGPGAARANAELLDHGTLYVARFDADGRGRWLPLVHGQGPLTSERGFADPGEVMVKARQASDALGATRMDRPEWLAIDAATLRVYCALTNNRARGQAGAPGVDAANPRAGNTMGHIIRWREAGDFDGESFAWEHFVLAGDPANARPEARGNVRGDLFACPDGLAIDTRGVLWIDTDMGPKAMHRGEFARLGNNAMLACDPASGAIRRFLVGPVNCEIAGAAWTPDGCTMFVDIQHPGEPPGARSDPAEPRRWSNWPDFRPDGRPRSAIVVIRKDDGGPIGT